MGNMGEYVRCPKCGATNESNAIYCKRCGFKVKKSYISISNSLAFLISSVIFYVPANIEPILQTNKLATSTNNTIISGIFELWQDGDVPIAIIVFLASVLIPILKFVILFYLIADIKSCKFINFKKKLYKFIEVSGPWSLLDVFVVFVLSVMVHFASVSVVPKDGAFYFLIMVIFLILASLSFDERLIGEKCK